MGERREDMSDSDVGESRADRSDSDVGESIERTGATVMLEREEMT